MNQLSRCVLCAQQYYHAHQQKGTVLNSQVVALVACQLTDCIQDTLNDYYVQGIQWWTSPVHNRYATTQEVEMSVTTNKYVTVQPFLTLKINASSTRLRMTNRISRYSSLPQFCFRNSQMALAKINYFVSTQKCEETNLPHSVENYFEEYFLRFPKEEPDATVTHVL